MSIKYSILVPVYNVEQYIRECIESVLRQTYVNYELILVDDGSTDRSGEICDEYAKKEPRIKVFHKPNQGQIHSRIYAIAHACGDYYVFLDSDDTLKANALDIINSKIEEYDCDCLIYGLERVQEGKIISKVYDKNEKVLEKKEDIYRTVFLKMEYNSLCRKAVKASVFHNIDYSPYYHLRYTEDLLQSIEIYKYCHKMVFIPTILYEYRMNLTSITHSVDRMVIDFTIRKKVLEFLKQEAIFTENDYDQYRDFCISIVIADIMKFCLSYEKRDQIKSKFARIRDDMYYKEFLSKGISNRRSIGVKSFIFDLFKCKKDNILISFVKYGYCIKQIIRKSIIMELK